MENLLQEIKDELEKVSNLKELNDLKVKYLSKKGPVNELSMVMKTLSVEEKKEYGMKLNNFRNEVNSLFDTLKDTLEKEELNKKLESEKIDITLPSKRIRKGSKHPMTRIKEELEDLFVSMGYEVYDGPEIETDENCFQKLNLPIGHPARDAQDTFYLENEYESYLLRSQTSTGQVRVMEANIEKGPIRVVCPGKVYRRDDDATHSHQFMQIEGLLVDKEVSLSDLKGTFDEVAKKLFGPDCKTRFRPSYYPFTEPSVETDISCFKCKGVGCPLCKNTGWITVSGAGMVHPKVLENCGYNPDEWMGFAFGFGAERLAMLKYGINDIRTFYNTDLREIDIFDRKERD